VTNSDLNEGEILRTVFFVSDRTGLSAAHYGKTLLAQFPNQKYQILTLSFIDTREKATIASNKIKSAYRTSGKQPIVFSTLVDETGQRILKSTDACIINLFNAFLEPLEQTFGEASSHVPGKFQANNGISGNLSYQKRLDAIDYSLSHDDGVRYDQYDEADVILVGVSRSGKTPTSLYLAMNFSLKVSNYPLTEEDLDKNVLPDFLLKHKHKLVALTIKVVPLSKIRRARRPNSEYSSLKVCEREIKISEAMFAHAKIPVFETTDTSIEEIASDVVQAMRFGLTENDD
jgi:regulator of PEP synthase PpsR (kinase-PPPase family)